MGCGACSKRKYERAENAKDDDSIKLVDERECPTAVKEPIETQKDSIEASKSFSGAETLAGTLHDTAHNVDYGDVPGQVVTSPTSPSSGLRLVPVKDAAVLKILSDMLFVRNPPQLGTGRDCRCYARKYHVLKLYCAWHVEHPRRRQLYTAKLNLISQQMEMIGGKAPYLRPLRVILPGGDKMPEGLRSDVNEHFLISGTKPQFLLPVLTQGFKNKLASTKDIFGPAVSFAEDAMKIDQDTLPDFDHNQAGLGSMHARFFWPGGPRHPGQGVEGSKEDLFYVIVARTVLGWYQTTLDGLKNLEYPELDLWDDVQDKCELAEIPDTDPPMRYHSLVAQPGKVLKRFREFMIYDDDQFYIEYVIAYQRT